MTKLFCCYCNLEQDGKVNECDNWQVIVCVLCGYVFRDCVFQVDSPGFVRSSKYESDTNSSRSGEDQITASVGSLTVDDSTEIATAHVNSESHTLGQGHASAANGGAVG